MRPITSVIALLFSILLVTANAAQDILESKDTKSTGIINVNSTCGDIRATSMSVSWAMQLFLIFCQQKRLLHFPDPMATSTG